MHRVLLLTLGLAACTTAPPSDPDAGRASSDAGTPISDDAGEPPAIDASDPSAIDAAVDRAQTPPRGRAAIEAWLAEGHYLSWRCEAEEHGARPPGAHRVNRICTNDLLSGASAGPFPPGAAAVKELYDRAGGEITGYAVSIKIDGDSAGGDGWYWYERVGTSIYADGTGVAICTGCHAGADERFAPTARDYVFTVVP